MSEGLYELLALGSRYVFAILMILIVVRAWRITIVDSRRAATLRRISPETGISGELVVIEGDERAKRGMKYPVIREGMIGNSRRADIRIRHSSIWRRHAYFHLTPEGLNIRAHANAPMRNGMQKSMREITLGDGDGITIGRIQLLLVLTQAPAPGKSYAMRRHSGRRADDGGYYDDDADTDDMFNPDPDQLFRENPILRHEPDPLYRAPSYDDEHEEELWWPDE